VHETGHALYARHRVDGDEDYAEPYFDLDQPFHNEGDGELGFALENILFKDVLQTIIHPKTGVEVEWVPILKARVDKEVVTVYI